MYAEISRATDSPSVLPPPALEDDMVQYSTPDMSKLRMPERPAEATGQEGQERQLEEEDKAGKSVPEQTDLHPLG